MTNKGIVGHEGAKFDHITEPIARSIIQNILWPVTPAMCGRLTLPDSVVVTGRCHLGGIDVWAEEIADDMGLDKIIHPPENHRWTPKGYKERNLKIAKDSDEVHVILVDEYPEHYSGMRFDYCYHCDTMIHIKSGGCWTARKAIILHDKPAYWHIIRRPITIGENVHV